MSHRGLFNKTHLSPPVIVSSPAPGAHVFEPLHLTPDLQLALWESIEMVQVRINGSTDGERGSAGGAQEVRLRSVSKSTPDPPDACSKERAQTFMTEQEIGGNCQGPDQDPFLPSIIPCLMMCVESGLKRDRQRALC